jgi:hypothetical protein
MHDMEVLSTMIAMSKSAPSMLATSSCDVSRRPMACTSCLPLGKDPSSSLKSVVHLHITCSGAMAKECLTLGTWSTYANSIRRIVFLLVMYSSSLYFQLNKY